VREDGRSIACGQHSFEFDRAFGPRSTQEDLFEDVSGLVTSVLDGYNVCVFAYGQTGAGKTWTMEGPPDSQTRTEKLLGVNYRALGALFHCIRYNPYDTSSFHSNIGPQGEIERKRSNIPFFCFFESRFEILEAILVGIEPSLVFDK
jgi:hypothetical protein